MLFASATQRRFLPKYIENTWLLGNPECFYISRSKYIQYLLGHLRGAWVFSKLQGLLYYFLENFSCNLTYYESENFSDSSLHHIFGSENNFRFPFFYEKQPNLGREMWKTPLRTGIYRESSLGAPALRQNHTYGITLNVVFICLRSFTIPMFS